MRYLPILVLLVAGCSKDPSIWKIRNLEGNRIAIFGHGGMGDKALLPMDSKSSLLECLNKGADGTEMDVRMTADGVLVLFHDEELGDMTTCSGDVRSQTLESLSS